MTQFRNAGLLLLALNILIPFFFLTLPPGLGPEGDALDYRLPLINWALKHRAYPFFDWTYVDDFPALGEMAMALAKVLVPWGPRIVAALGYAWFVLGTYRVAALLAPAPYATLAAALVACANVLTTQDNLIMVDNLAAAATLWGAYELMGHRPLRAGFFTGLGLATRYTQLPLFVATVFVLAVFVIAEGRRRKSLPQVLMREAVIFILTASLVLAPWLLRNLFHTQNPVYPLATSILGGEHFSVARNKEVFGMVATAVGFGMGPMALLLLPFRFAFYKSAFDYSVGGLPLMFLPWWLMAVKKTLPWALSLAWTLAWFYTSQNGRFFLPPLALIAAIAMSTAAVMLKGEGIFQRRARFAFLSLCLLAATAGTVKHVVKHKDEALYLMGKKTLPMVGNADVVSWLNAHRSEGAVALIKRSNDVHLMTGDWVFVYPHVYSNSRYDAREFASVGQMLTNLRATAHVAFLYIPSGPMPAGLKPEDTSTLMWEWAFTGATGATVWRLVTRVRAGAL